MTRQRQRYRQRLRHTYGRQSINRALLSLRHPAARQFCRSTYTIQVIVQSLST
jgi:hypothetical protein